MNSDNIDISRKIYDAFTPPSMKIIDVLSHYSEASIQLISSLTRIPNETVKKEIRSLKKLGLISFRYENKLEIYSISEQYRQADERLTSICRALEDQTGFR